MKNNIPKELFKKSGVYIIRNLIDNRVYIGSTKSLYQRYCQHLRRLSNGNHPSIYLSNFCKKHGIYEFVFEIIELCDSGILLSREQHWIDFYQSYKREYGFNSAKIAKNNSGFKLSEDAKLKISMLHKGKKLSREHIDKIKATRKRGKQGPSGYRHTEETKLKISKNSKGNKNNLGRKFSDDTKKKMSETQKKRIRTKEEIDAFSERISKKNIGNKYCLGRKQSPEHIANRLKSMALKKLLKLNTHQC